jgi:hypothetical protein
VLLYAAPRKLQLASAGVVGESQSTLAHPACRHANIVKSAAIRQTHDLLSVHLYVQVLDWFGQFGFRIPFGVSIADYILDISLGEAGYSSSGKSGSAAVTELYTAFEQQYAGKANAHKYNTGFSYEQPQISNGEAGAAAALPVSSGGAAGIVGKGSSSSSSSSNKESSKRVGARYWDQLVVLWRVSCRLRWQQQQHMLHRWVTNVLLLRQPPTVVWSLPWE